MGFLQDTIDNLLTLGPKAGLDRFAASIEPGWIEEALEATGKASLRTRKLPAEKIIWLVLGMALYSNRAIHTILVHLGLAQGSDHVVPSATSQARYRLGPEPLQWLFQKVCDAWSDTSAATYKALSLYGIDGTCLRVPDTDENYAHFGKPGGPAGVDDSGYPQLRLVALMNLSNRMLAGAAMQPYKTGEPILAKELLPRIPGNSLTVLDRGLFNYMTALEIAGAGENRHILARIKKDVEFETLKALPDGTVRALLHAPKYLVKRDPDLPGPIEVRVIAYQHKGGEECRLITTLLDPDHYPAQELVELYHARWELEIGFDEFKTHMLERKESLRSKKPEGIYQEVWGALLLYNLVRREMFLTAQELELPATRISFRESLLIIRDVWTTAWMLSPGNVPRELKDLRQYLKTLVLPKRRSQRRYPRHVKIKMSKYARNRGRRHDSGTN